MPIQFCGSCEKMISISRLPGGNPMAKAQGMAMAYGVCDRCRRDYCDQCIGNAGGKCPGCGKRIEIKGPPAGQTAELPDKYKEAIKKAQAHDQERKEEKLAPRKKAVAILLLILGLVIVTVTSLVVIAMSPVGSIGHDTGWIVLKSLLVLAVYWIGAVLGVLIANIASVGLHFLPARILTSIYFLALLASPAFIYYAWKVLTLDWWQIAYCYTALFAVLMSGLRALRGPASRVSEAVRTSRAMRLFNDGISLSRRGSFKQAIERFDSAIQEDPKLPQPWNAKGAALYDLDRYDEALICIDRALELDPNNPHAWGNKGNILRQLERVPDAISAYQKFIELAPPEYSGQREEAEAYIRLHK